MPSEVSIAKPLSGTECLDACMSSLRTALGKDDRFSTHMAYSGFRAVIDFKFMPSMTFVPDVERTVEVVDGDMVGAELTADMVNSPTFGMIVEIPVRPPNQVREEAKMPQPVLVTDSKGQAHEEWKTVGKAPKNAAVPKNKMKGL